MALSQAALCELAAVKTALGIAVSTYDTTLERLIEVASARINRYCNRTFHRADEISEYVAAYGLTHLLVSRPPILTIDWVKFDGVTVDSSAYECYSEHAQQGVIHNSGGWTWTCAGLDNIDASSMPGTEQLLYQVQYDGGYVTANQVTLTTFATRTLPYEIEQAAIDFAALMYHRQGDDPRIQSESVDGASVSYSVTGQLSMDMPDYIRVPLTAYRLVPQS